MKKLFLIIFILTSLSLSAQNDAVEVTKFLGIPIDGTKSEMIQKLKAKGFVSSDYDSEILKEEFNGYNVELYIGTDNNKVFRIMVADLYSIDETNIKNRFNTLCHQFERNSKYICGNNEGYIIPEDENIGYEITVNKKEYVAYYYQKSPADTTITDSNFNELTQGTYNIAEVSDAEELDRLLNLRAEALSIMNRPVWFIIKEIDGEYIIIMYYDNILNRANGEDL